MKHKKPITNKHIKAIRKILKVAQALIKDHPEIAEDYRNGMFNFEITQKYNVESEYGASANIARKAVGQAIRGHKGGFGFKPCTGLITDPSELEMLCKKPGKNIGKRILDRKVGIHSESYFGEEGKSEKRSQAGQLGGTATFESGKGLFAKSPEERREYRLKGLRAQGYTPFIDRIFTKTSCTLSEKEFAHGLSQLPEYRMGPIISARLIAEKLNKLYHNGSLVRDGKSVSRALCIYRKKIKSELS
ncbi:hypothetical protein GOV06_02610 [Candidatus Woesearchaeota archaeon]|nr:hypothetical protein [Candidatus Woesearchaeota archaeon]